MPKVAFIVLKSPAEQNPTHTFKRLADRRDSSAILIEDGVYHALHVRSAGRLNKAAHEVLVSRQEGIRRPT